MKHGLKTIVFGFSMVLGLFECLAQSKELKQNCTRQSFENNNFVVCQFDVKKNDIAILWKGKDGEPLGSLSRVKGEIRKTGRRLVFAMNGGMYHQDLAPVGYYVENGKKIKNASTRRGPGNFHMLPNGIFYLENQTAGVMETRAFLRRNQRPKYATQSGPMLVIRNRIHPLFKPSSSFKKRRNAVGVSRDGRQVYFVISENSVTFYSLAKFFLKKLKTPNALYLDGGHVPQMVTNTISIPSFSPVGPVVVVTKKDDRQSKLLNSIIKRSRHEN